MTNILARGDKIKIGKYWYISEEKLNQKIKRLKEEILDSNMVGWYKEFDEIIDKIFGEELTQEEE